MLVKTGFPGLLRLAPKCAPRRHLLCDWEMAGALERLRPVLLSNVIRVRTTVPVKVACSAVVSKTVVNGPVAVSPSLSTVRVEVTVTVPAPNELPTGTRCMNLTAYSCGPVLVQIP